MRHRRLLAGLLVLAAGCSLPLPRGVRDAGPAPAEQSRAGGISVLPPGPRDGAVPVDVVQGFLGAQSSAEGRHAVARSFLATPLQRTWDDAAGVKVVDPATVLVQQQPGTAGVDQTTVTVTEGVTGQVAQDGAYVVRAATLTESYRLQRPPGGQWRLVDVPAGLRLTTADRLRSYRVLRTYYLAAADAVTHSGSPHLVPDLVMLPLPGGSPPLDVATALVQRLLAAPTAALGDSVRSAVPAGTTLRSVRLAAAGVVAVDLAVPGTAPAAQDAQDLSAQLVWTLRGLGPGFAALRLLVDGRPLVVPGEDELQASGEWDVYDPDGLAPSPPLYYVAGRRLKAVGGPSAPAGPGPAGDGQAVRVDAVAVTPDLSRLAVLTSLSGGRVALRLGSPSVSTYRLVLTGDRLRSPTWGSGGRGLFMLQGAAQVLLVGSGAPRPVTVEGAPPGPWSSLAVSRDGVRVALVAAGRLYVGRVAPGPAPAFVGLRQVAPSVLSATVVAWDSAASLVVLGSVQQTFLPVRLSVDGATVTPLDGPGLPARPVGLTASPAGTVVTAAGRLYVVNGSGFAASVMGSAPAYPG
ncbi:MAG: GerMN domain-containing protein [Pseudorhodobacter sp.]|nr:GerMN domain-containing protein [Frankiaceae bacterium]